MKKNNPPGQQSSIPKAAGHCLNRPRRRRPGRLLFDFLPALTVVMVLTTLVLYLLVSPDAGLLVQPSAGTAHQTATVSGEAAVLLSAEVDYQDFLLSRSRNLADLQNRTASGVSLTAISDWPLYAVLQPGQLFDPETALATDPATDPATEPTADSATVADPTPAADPGFAAAAEPAAEPEPAADPRQFDADGVPQELLPVSEFTADNTLVFVQVNRANIRELPNTSAGIVMTATMGDTLTRLGYGRDWSQVQADDGRTGFVLTSLITTDAVARPTPSPTPKPTAAPTPKPAAAPAAASGSGAGSMTAQQQQDVIDLAKSCLGVKYVYGCESPDEGFDCSGLTTYIYSRLFGITLPRSARGQSSAGISISRANIAIGDIICFDWDGGDGLCDHVGIYIGGGDYIHATHSGGSVVQSTLKPTNPVVSIRRIIY